MAAAVFCDPPYNLRVSSIGGRGRNKHPEFAFGSGEMQPQQFQRFLSKILANGIRVSADGAIHFVCIDWRHVVDLIMISRKIYGSDAQSRGLEQVECRSGFIVSFAT